MDALEQFLRSTYAEAKAQFPDALVFFMAVQDAAGPNVRVVSMTDLDSSEVIDMVEGLDEDPGESVPLRRH